MDRLKLALAIAVLRAKRPCETNRDAIRRLTKTMMQSRNIAEEGLFLTHKLHQLLQQEQVTPDLIRSAVSLLSHNIGSEREGDTVGNLLGELILNKKFARQDEEQRSLIVQLLRRVDAGEIRRFCEENDEQLAKAFDKRSCEERLFVGYVWWLAGYKKQLFDW